VSYHRTPLRAEVSRFLRSLTNRLNEWRNDQWGATLQSLNPDDQSLWKITKRLMRVPTPSPPGYSGGNRPLWFWEDGGTCWQSGTRFQPVTVQSVPAVIEVVGLALESYLQTPASQPMLTGPEDVHSAIRGLKIGKAPGRNGISNRALKHLPKEAVTFLVLKSI
jgi:hypothetical protein